MNFSEFWNLAGWLRSFLVVGISIVSYAFLFGQGLGNRDARLLAIETRLTAHEAEQTGSLKAIEGKIDTQTTSINGLEKQMAQVNTNIEWLKKFKQQMSSVGNGDYAKKGDSR